jgi:hypothetical protein
MFHLSSGVDVVPRQPATRKKFIHGSAGARSKCFYMDPHLSHLARKAADEAHSLGLNALERALSNPVPDTEAKKTFTSHKITVLQRMRPSFAFFYTKQASTT